MTKITINGISIDPETQGAALASAGLFSLDSADSNYIIAQTAEPLTPPQKSELEALGARIIDYAQENAYICYYLPSDLDAIRALPYVEWANVYLKDFKVAAQLRSPSAPAPVANLLSLGAPETSMSQEPRTVEV